MEEMNRPTVFIGSTGERSDIADAMVQHLSSVAEVTHWEDAFPPGPTIYDNLMSLKDNFDFAVFVLTADDFINSRDKEYQVPRDNVIFELGLFLGSIGTGRVFAVIDKNVPTKLPTDLTGVVYLTYDPNRKDGRVGPALRPACISIKEQVELRGARESAMGDETSSPDLRLMGVEKVYDSYADAEPDIFSTFRNTKGPVRLLLYVASQDVGVKGPILDLIDEASQRGVEVRILHADPRSPTFSKERLEHIGKDYDRVRNTIEYVTTELNRLQQSERPLFRRGHDLPFIWRMYVFPEHMYLMPYYADKDATTKSPVVRYSNSGLSMYGNYLNLYEHLWAKLSPRRVQLSELIGKSTATGTALILNWNGRHVFGIPRRDLNNGSGHVRFYGLGGKRETYDETLTDCALREGNEESGGAVAAVVPSQTTILSRYDGSVEEIELQGDETSPLLIIEKQRFLGVRTKSTQTPDELIYTFCYYGELKKKPKPTREIAAILIMDDEHLKSFRRSAYMTISDLVAMGVELQQADGLTIDLDSVLIPHGTANYLLNQS